MRVDKPRQDQGVRMILDARSWIRMAHIIGSPACQDMTVLHRYCARRIELRSSGPVDLRIAGKPEGLAQVKRDV